MLPSVVLDEHLEPRIAEVEPHEHLAVRVADEVELRRRVAARQAQGNDVSDADTRVLEQQMAAREALDSGELKLARDLTAGR